MANPQDRKFFIILFWVGAGAMVAVIAQDSFWPSAPERIQRLLAAALILSIAGLSGRFAFMGIRDGTVTYGKLRARTVARKTQPIEFWFVVGVFTLCAVGLAGVAIAINFLSAT